MIELALVGLGLSALHLSGLSHGIPTPPQYKHPSFKPTRTDFEPQPPLDKKAYRGSTAIRTKPSRHQRKRNKG